MAVGAVTVGAKGKVKRPLPPPPGTATAKGAVSPVVAAPGTSSVSVTKSAPAPGVAGGLIKETAEATNQLGKKAIGEGGFHADLNIGNDMDKLIQKNLTDRLEGRNPTFSDEIMAAHKEKLFRETQGQTRRGRMALMADSARRGVFRSEATGTLVRDLEIAGMQQYSSGVKDLMIAKAQQDHEDMVQAIGQAQQWMQGLRQYALGLEQNAIAREQIKATLAAAAMQASATMYAADQGLKGARANAGAIRVGQQQAYNDSRYMVRDSAAPGGFAVHGSGMSIQQAQFAGLGLG